MDGIVKCWNLVVVGCIILACKDPALSANFHVEVVKLPPLRIGKQQIRAHTQGLELVRGNIYVTARREDVNPRQALLLRTSLSAANWEVWNITPVDADGAMLLDHPGGMQSDGKRLWIPIAESKPKSRTMIRAFSMESIVPGVPLKAEFEFPFNDHIGALAVSMQDESTHPGTNQNLLLGANWDTETV